ncbi:hypothetical protein, partial [Spiroplasma sp. hyd1]
KKLRLDDKGNPILNDKKEFEIEEVDLDSLMADEIKKQVNEQGEKLAEEKAKEILTKQLEDQTTKTKTEKEDRLAVLEKQFAEIQQGIKRNQGVGVTQENKQSDNLNVNNNQESNSSMGIDLQSFKIVGGSE